MKNNQHVEMTSIEIGALWRTYFSETITKCVITHFLENVEDPDIEALLLHALNIIHKRVPKIEELLTNEGIPVPHGFTDKDVYSNAPRLFSDPFYLYYIWFMSSVELTYHSATMSLCSRSDVNDFYREVLNGSADTDTKARELALEKGYFNRAPYIPIPKEVDFVKKQSFLTGWLGERRPLNASEITHLFRNAMNNTIGNTLMTGFSQVAKSEKIRKNFVRGREIASKHTEIFTSLLKEENLSSFDAWAQYATDSNTPPFSDKLMVYHVNGLNEVGIGNYGVSLAQSPRRDLGTHYSRLTSEVALYAEDTTELLIENGWLEQPPSAADRDHLAK